MEKKTGFKRYLIGACLLVFTCTTASARARQFGYCEQGGQKVTTAGTRSSTLVQASNPGCLVTVFQSDGITLASLFSDNSGTVLSNPFQADTLSGYWDFYADNGRYNVQLSGGTVQGTIVLGDVILTDPAAGGFVPGGPAGGDLSGTYPNPNVPFTNLGTGAVTTHVATRLQETISVTDYGAVSGDSGDQSGAFQLAVNQAVARGGGYVSFPCGTYRTTNPITINSPLVSLGGQGQTCSVIHYTGTGSAIVWQMVPFGITPAGTFENFTVLGTSAGLNGILSGQIVASQWRNLTVTGFTGVGAAGIHLHNLGNLTTWTERNDFIGVSVGGLANSYNTIGLLMDSDNIGDSFGYNRFLDLKINTSTGGAGLWFKSGFFYNSVLTATCNSDNNLGGTTGPICIRSSGNWDSIFSTLHGEFQNTGPGTGTPYSVQVDVGGKFNGWGHMSMFTTGGANMAVNNLAGSSAVSTVTLQQGQNQTSWDTGSFTLPVYGTTGVPNPAYRTTYGSVGVLNGNNFESPYASMFEHTGNAFVVGSVAAGNPIGNMTPRWLVDVSGNVVNTSHLWVNFPVSGIGSVDPNAISDINGRAVVRGAQGHYTIGLEGSLLVGGVTNADRAGYANIGLLPTTGINESISWDGNSSNGFGTFFGTNLGHSLSWSYSLDPLAYEWYLKTFATPLSNGQQIASLGSDGSFYPKGHLGQASAGNIAGTVTLTASTSGTATFPVAFVVPPICVVTVFTTAAPPAITYGCQTSTAGITVWTSSAVTGTFNYVVVGNPN